MMHTTIVMFAILSNRVFLYFPMISSLLRRMIKNTSAAGRRVTAMT